MKIIIRESQLNKIMDTELGERSRSFAFTRKKRLFPKVAKKYASNRFREYEREVGEVEVRQKNPLGAGLYHRVYESKRYPDRVFKVGLYDSVREAYGLFMNYPYMFPKVYGYKKLGEMTDKDGEDLYYLILEKLDTKRFVLFWGNLSLIAEKVVNERLYSLVFDLNYKESEWNDLFDYLKVNKKEYYDDTLELYNLVRELNEIYEYPDLHNGQFGYDKDGVLKCLDF